MVGAVGAMGCEPHGQVVEAVGDSPRTPEGGQAGKRWWEVRWERWKLWEGWELWGSPRTPEGGQARKRWWEL